MNGDEAFCQAMERLRRLRRRRNRSRCPGGRRKGGGGGGASARARRRRRRRAVGAGSEPLLAAGLTEARRGTEPGLAPSASGRKERLGLGASGPTRTLYYAHA